MGDESITIEVTARLNGETSKGTKKFDLDGSGLSGTIYCKNDRFTELGSPTELPFVINVGVPAGS